MTAPWWTCTHDGIGLPGCPTCDGRWPAVGCDNTGAWRLRSRTDNNNLIDDARGWLREARDEIARQADEIRSLRGRLAILDVMASESSIPNTMRSVTRGCGGSDV